MNALSLNIPRKHFSFIIQNLVSVFVTLFLFYIDEGYYSFKWMHEPGAWFVFILYFAFFGIGQMITKVYIFKKEYNILTSIVIGFIGLAISIGVVMLFVLIAALMSKGLTLYKTW